jgi:hypothetical protein
VTLTGEQEEQRVATELEVCAALGSSGVQHALKIDVDCVGQPLGTLFAQLRKPL